MPTDVDTTKQMIGENVVGRVGVSKVRLVAVVLTVWLALGFGAAPASAHTPREFGLCFSFVRTSLRCTGWATTPGHMVYLRGHITGHSGQVQVMFRNANSNRNARSIGTATIKANGNINYAWRAPDIGNYEFFLLKPGHGATRTAPLEVLGGCKATDSQSASYAARGC